MESVYAPDCFHSSENFPVKDYFTSYSTLCHFHHAYTGIKGSKHETNLEWRKIMQEMNVDIEYKNFQQLEKNCRISKLTVPDEPVECPAEIPEKLQTKSMLQDYYPITEKAKQLEVVSCKVMLDKEFDTANLKFGSKRFLKTATVHSNKSLLSDMLPGSNIIFTIMVYRPFSIGYGIKNSAEKMRLAYEIDALGTNTLAEVADKIVCVANEAIFKEVEDTNVDLTPFLKAREHYPSQSIFIDGVFYNDHRSPNAIDYSTDIIAWAKDKGIGEFKNNVMEKTTLDSLQPRFGYPYVYMHQGNCEHIFAFTDARLIQPNDSLYSKKYPRIVTISRTSNIMCFICGILHSKWVVMNCDRFPNEKVFLCTDCCNSYLYVDGKKVTDFKLYPYYDEDVLTRNLNEIVIEVEV